MLFTKNFVRILKIQQDTTVQRFFFLFGAVKLKNCWNFWQKSYGQFLIGIIREHGIILLNIFLKSYCVFDSP